MIALQGAIQFNGGGHLNHSIFWQNLCPVKDVVAPSEANPELAKAIEGQWGSLDNFKTEFNTKTAAIQGSGWGWLGYNKQSKKLEIATCANQDPLVMKGLVEYQHCRGMASYLFLRSPSSASTCGSTRITCSTRTLDLST